MCCAAAGMRRAVTVAIQTAIACLVLVQARASGAGTAPNRVLLLTDLHYDLYHGSENAFGPCTQPPSRTEAFGSFGCDSPLALVASTIEAAKAVLPEPDFVLVCGDSVRHDAHEMPHGWKDITKSFEHVSAAMRSAFPTAPHVHASVMDAHTTAVLYAAGNNDVKYDYVLNITDGVQPNPVLLEWARVWGEDLDAVQLDQLSKGGFYESEVATGLRVISLNTVIYSRWHACVGPQKWIEPSSDPQIPDDGCGAAADPFGQFAWLRARLENARDLGIKVWITGHIPPIVGSYLPQPDALMKRTAFWRPKWATQYYTILQQQKEVVAAQLFGHLHSDEFRVFEEGAMGYGLPPMLVSSAVTPVYGNNPSFKVLHYDPDTKAIVDYDVYAAPLPNEAAHEDETMKHELEDGNSNDNSNEGGDVGSSGDDSDAGIKLEWTKFYSAKAFFGMRDLSTASYSLLRDKLAGNQGGFFSTFYEYAYRAGAVPAIPCSDTCVVGYHCLLGTANMMEYATCVNASADNPADPALKMVGGVVFGAFAGVSVLLAVLIAAGIALRRRERGGSAKYATMDSTMLNSSYLDDGDDATA